MEVKRKFEVAYLPEAREFLIGINTVYWLSGIKQRKWIHLLLLRMVSLRKQTKRL
jgi:hypothetical protein